MSNTSSGSYYPNSRARATTVNQMDTIPPALARLQHMNQDIIGGRNALTPVLNRDDAMREWERRQSGKPPAAQPYPQLEYLQQQAEMVSASGLPTWNTATHTRYQAAPSKLQHSYQPHTIMVDEDNGSGGSGGGSSRRDAVMQNVRAAARNDAAGLYGGGVAPSMISNPPQAYSGGGTGGRYTTNYGQSTNTGASGGTGSTGYDAYAPMGEQYQGYGSATSSNRHPTSQQQLPPSFYGGAVVPSGPQQQRNPFNMPNVDAQQKDQRWQQR